MVFGRLSNKFRHLVFDGWCDYYICMNKVLLVICMVALFSCSKNSDVENNDVTPAAVTPTYLDGSWTTQSMEETGSVKLAPFRRLYFNFDGPNVTYVVR